VLPRKFAAAVTVSAVARSGRAIAAATILVSILGLTDLFLREGYPQDLALPVFAMVVMLGVVALATFRPSRITLTLYVVVGGICVYLYLLGTLGDHPTLLPVALLLVNRPATALVLVGASSSRPLPAIAWGIAGFVAGGAATALVCLQLGLPIEFGNGPAIALANYCVVYLGLSLIQRAQRGRVPDFLVLRAEARKLEATRRLEQRAVAVLHDTVLNDLALVINGPDTLDDRTRNRMREDVATLAEADLLTDIDRATFVDSSDASLRNQLMALVCDFQWRGLSVEVTGDAGEVAHITPAAVVAAVGALRACLENVLAHSGAASAELIVSATDTSLSWTVSDAGRGFDPGAIAPDRLGLRNSVFGRVQSAGGMVRVWSASGQGTSVLITLPMTLAEAVPERGADV
jgi:signal transduction histidine kinase